MAKRILTFSQAARAGIELWAFGGQVKLEHVSQTIPDLFIFCLQCGRVPYPDERGSTFR